VAPDGMAGFTLNDRNGKLRFGVGTNSDGETGVTLYDSNEKAIWSQTSASPP
jgi:hypothetical protein